MSAYGTHMSVQQKLLEAVRIPMCGPECLSPQQVNYRFWYERGSTASLPTAATLAGWKMKLSPACLLCLFKSCTTAHTTRYSLEYTNSYHHSYLPCLLSVWVYPGFMLVKNQPIIVINCNICKTWYNHHWELWNPIYWTHGPEKQQGCHQGHPWV